MKILIVTPLKLEYDAIVERIGNCPCGEDTNLNLIHKKYTYSHGEYVCDILLVEVGEGNIAAALNTKKALDAFLPDYVFLSGIAGGIKDVIIGDVVVSTEIRSYEPARVSDNGILQRSYSKSAGSKLIYRANRLKSNKEYGFKIYVRPIVSGEKIIADRNNETFRVISQSASDALALETEGYGFINAIEDYNNGKKLSISGIVVRGISDKLEGKTEADNSGSQPKAAQNAATIVFDMIDAILQEEKTVVFKKTQDIAASDLLKNRVKANFYEDIYFERDVCDGEIAKLFNENENANKKTANRISILGASLSGKSRMVYHFIRTKLNKAYLIHVVTPKSLESLLDYQYAKDSKYLIVIDDINIEFEPTDIKKLFNAIGSHVDVIATCSSNEWKSVPEYIKDLFSREIHIPSLTTSELSEFTRKLITEGIRVNDKHSSIGGLFIDMKTIRQKIDAIQKDETNSYPLFKAIYYFSMWKRLNRGNIKAMHDFLKKSFSILTIVELYTAAKRLADEGVVFYIDQRDENNRPHIHVEEYILDDIISNSIYSQNEKEKIEFAKRTNRIEQVKSEIECEHINEILNYDASFETLTKVFWRVKYVETKKYIINLFFGEQLGSPNSNETNEQGWVDSVRKKIWDSDENEEERQYHMRFISGAIYYCESFAAALRIFQKAVEQQLNDPYQFGCLIGKIENEQQLAELLDSPLNNETTSVNESIYIYSKYIYVAFSFEAAWSSFQEASAFLLSKLKRNKSTNAWLDASDDNDDDDSPDDERTEYYVKRLIYSIFQKAETMDHLSRIETYYEDNYKSVLILNEDTLFSSLPIYIHKTLISTFRGKEEWLTLLEKQQREVSVPYKKSIIENFYISLEDDFFEAIELYELIQTRDVFTFSLLLRKDNCIFDSAKEIFLSDYSPSVNKVNDVILNILLAKAPNSTEADWVLSLFQKYNVPFDNYSLNAILKFDWVTPEKAKDLIEKNNWYHQVNEETLGRIISKKETSFADSAYYISYDATDPFKSKLPKKLFQLAQRNFEIKKELFSKNISPAERKTLNEILANLKKETENSPVMRRIYGRYVANKSLIKSYTEAVQFLEENDVKVGDYDKYILGTLLTLLREEYLVYLRQRKYSCIISLISHINELIKQLPIESQSEAIISYRLKFFHKRDERQNCVFISANQIEEKQCTIIEYVNEIIRLGFQINEYTIGILLNKLKKNDESDLRYILQCLESSPIKLSYKLYNRIVDYHDQLFQNNPELRKRLESFLKDKLDNAYFISLVNAGKSYEDICKMLSEERKLYILSLSFWNAVLKKLHGKKFKDGFQQGVRIYETYIKDKYRLSVHTFVSLFALANNKEEMNVVSKYLYEYNKDKPENQVIHLNREMYTSIVNVQSTVAETIQEIRNAKQYGVDLSAYLYNALLNKYVKEEKKNSGVHIQLLKDFLATLIGKNQINVNVLMKAERFEYVDADIVTFNILLQLSSFTDVLLQAMDKFNLKYDGYTYFTILGTIPINAPDAFEKSKLYAEKCKSESLLTVSILDLLFQRAKTIEDVCWLYVFAFTELGTIADPYVGKTQKLVKKEISPLLDKIKHGSSEERPEQILTLTNLVLNNLGLIIEPCRIPFRYNYIQFIVNESILNWKKRVNDPYFKTLESICDEYVNENFCLVKGGEEEIKNILYKHLGCERLLKQR